ncbi:MAG: peptidase E [Gaiellaceae bacterium]
MQIFAMSGLPDDTLLDYALGLASGRRVLYVPTPGMEDPASTVWWYERLHGRVEMTHLHFLPYPPADLRRVALSHDVIFVTGGNTANALAIWRAHGFDTVLREAWENGVLLTGWSAGAICWFDAAVTDSFGPQLEGMQDGLGFLPGSACPHYDGEELRRPRYAELVRAGFPPGIAIDDDAAVRFDGTELAEVVTSREGAGAYRMGVDGEVPLDVRRLS